MSSSISFSGTGFDLQSVTVLNNGAVLRVRFSNDPLKASATGTNDALNTANYTLLGAGYVGINSVLSVGADPQAVDLVLSSKLSSGTWTLTASTNIKSVTANNLVAPTSATFVVTTLINTQIINPGSQNDNEEDILRKHLNPALKGPGWDAVIAGLATGDATVNKNTQLAFDQLYKISASGKYLDRITANDGVTRPANVGISDDVYRKLAIGITNKKVVQQSILEVLAIYYGEDAVRAHATTEGFAPYALSDMDDLNVTIDGLTKVKVVFKQAEFNLIGAATALEVASAITRAFILAGSQAYALSFIDPTDGKSKVKIYSQSLGLKGSVQIRGSGGGKAQSVLKFNTSLSALVYQGIVTPPIPPVVTATFTLDGTTDQGMDSGVFL